MSFVGKAYLEGQGDLVRMEKNMETTIGFRVRGLSKEVNHGDNSGYHMGYKGCSPTFSVPLTLHVHTLRLQTDQCPMCGLGFRL